MATREEIEQLKRQWEEDPCFDLAEVEGFEEHAEELRAHQEKMEKLWMERVNAELEKKAKQLNAPVALVEYLIRLEERIDVLEEQLDSLDIGRKG